MKRYAALALAALMALALFVSCGRREDGPAPTAEPTALPTAAPREPIDMDAGERYTFTVVSPELPSCWSALSERNADEELVCRLTCPPLVEAQVLDAEDGTFQWVLRLVNSVRDVTASHREDISAYGAETDGAAPEETLGGFVFEVRLRSDICWQNGRSLNADDVIRTFELMLDPAAALPIGAELCALPAAPAGAESYYLSQREARFVPVSALGFRSNAGAIAAGHTPYIDVHALGGLEGAVSETGAPCPRWAAFDDVTPYHIEGSDAPAVTPAELWNEYRRKLEIGFELEALCALRVEKGRTDAAFAGTVGVYKTGDYSFNYVCSGKADRKSLFRALSLIRPVYAPYYTRAGETDELDVPRGYCTNGKNTMSCGPYVIDSFERGSSLTLTRNPLWYGWRKAADGSAYAITDYSVSGERLICWQATSVVFKTASAEEAFAALAYGSADAVRPYPGSAGSAAKGRLSEPTDGVLTFVVNTDEEALTALDGKQNSGSILLSQMSFRRAMSLALDRAAIASELGGTPELGLIGSASLTEGYAYPPAYYRSTEEAKRAIAEAYAPQAGEEASETIPLTGFDRQTARALMEQAAEELIGRGLYREEQPVTVSVACRGGYAADAACVELTQYYLNVAAAGTKLGHIELIPVAVPEEGTRAVFGGEFAMCLTLVKWGGPAEFLRRAFDPDLFPGENLVPDPAGTLIEMRQEGRFVKISCEQWALRLGPGGSLASSRQEVKLGVCAGIEARLLGEYSCIPVVSPSGGVYPGEKAGFLLPGYSPYFGRGGFELMRFRFSDAEWEARKEELPVP
ncbi:MAG: hypothetical protein IKG85_08030 [Clostridia bacterium]|nr:hypothetical protein [Clostridia bacterium]